MQLVSKFAQKLMPAVLNEQQAFFEAWLLIEKATGKKRVSLLAHNQVLTPSQVNQVEQWIVERVEHKKPLAYILGNVPFGAITLAIRHPILVPRPETEEMAAWIIEQYRMRAQEPLVVLDLCTGSGCIALALAHAFPAWKVIGVDSNPAAIELADENRRALKVENATFYQASVFEEGVWRQSCDLIVSNPPYINQSSRDLVSPEVLAWEDEKALFADDEGWAFYELLVKLARLLVRPTSLSISTLIFEFGADQDSMEEFLLNRGCRSIEIHRDAAGIKRWAGSQV